MADGTEGNFTITEPMQLLLRQFRDVENISLGRLPASSGATLASDHEEKWIQAEGEPCWVVKTHAESGSDLSLFYFSADESKVTTVLLYVPEEEFSLALDEVSDFYNGVLQIRTENPAIQISKHIPGIDHLRLYQKLEDRHDEEEVVQLIADYVNAASSDELIIWLEMAADCPKAVEQLMAEARAVNQKVVDLAG